MPLPRPHDGQAVKPPTPPASLGGIGDYPVLLRIAQRLNLPISRIDELTMEQCLDERDMIMYLHDLDNPPLPPPKTPENVLKAASRAMTGG